ncbi:MAG: hypothetical protein ABIH42_07010 [Planctomycetota bacterium]
MRFIATLTIALIATIVVIFAQTDEQQTIKPEELANSMPDHEGMEHSFKDIMGYIYKDLAEFPEYLKFDTYHVRCRIQIINDEDRRLLEIWSRGEIQKPEEMSFKDVNLQLIKEIYFDEIEPHPLAFYGTVIDCDKEKVVEGVSFGYQYTFEVNRVERVKYTKE